MIARVDFMVALAVAAGLHVAGFGVYAARGGFDGAGAGGETSLSLQAAPAGMAAMVAEWNRVPDVALDVIELDAPVAEPDVDKVDVWHDAMVIAPSPKLAELTVVAQAPEVSIKVASLPEAETSVSPVSVSTRTAPPVLTAAASMITLPTFEASPRAMDAPKPLDHAIQIPKRPVARPVGNPPAPALVARGAGAGVSAGASRAVQVVATTSPSARTAAQTTWAASIQRRIARHQTYPRGSRGAGRVRLAMDILADGRLGSVRVDRSSGVAAFDRAAVRAAEAAAPFAPAPKELDRARYGFAQWVSFSR